MTWALFWGLLLLASLTAFAILAVFVTIGGFKDALAMFRGLDEKHDAEDRARDQASKEEENA